MIAVSDWDRSNAFYRDVLGAAHVQAHGVDLELGPVERRGARGRGTSVYFRDPEGSRLELIAYD